MLKSFFELVSHYKLQLLHNINCVGADQHVVGINATQEFTKTNRVLVMIQECSKRYIVASA